MSVLQQHDLERQRDETAAVVAQHMGIQLTLPSDAGSSHALQIHSDSMVTEDSLRDGHDRLKEKFKVVAKIGEGTYGVVYKCRGVLTGRLVAMKRIRFDADDEGVPSTALREISTLREINHKNVVRLLDIWDGSSECGLFDMVCNDSVTEPLMLVFEFLDMDLKGYMEKHNSPILGVKLKKIMWQLLDGIRACHDRWICHRDLKSHNILCNADASVCKIADFGLARTFRVPTSTYTHEIVTLWYRAPEILLGARHYLPAVDIWALGCIMAELARHNPLFAGDSEIHQLFNIFSVLGTPSESTWPGVSELEMYQSVFPKWPGKDLTRLIPGLDVQGLDLLLQMFEYHPYNRITAYSALQHPWFDEIREEMTNSTHSEPHNCATSTDMGSSNKENIS